MTAKKSRASAPKGFGMIDSHAHLDIQYWKDDREGVVARAKQADLGGIIVVACAGSPTIFSEVSDFVSSSDYLWMTAGVHPHDARLCNEALPELKAVLDTGLPVAAGETGLDFHYNLSSPDAQRASFELHLQLAADYALPVSLHVRNAFEESLEVLDNFSGPLTGVVHCFTGNVVQAEAYLKRGLHISIPGVVTFPKRGELDQAIRAIPKDRLLLETDSPYLSPAPLRGRRNEPANVVYVAKEIATILNIDIQDLAGLTCENTKRLFKLEIET